MPAPEHVEALARQLQCPAPLATLLLQRGVDTVGQAQAFLQPSLEALHDPFLMLGMDLAVGRLCRALDRQERICVYGDYDVDGTTAVALVYTTLQQVGAQVDYYVPDRYSEGYGLSQAGVDRALERQVDVLLCLDCGTKAFAQVARAREAGMDVLIGDHHEPDRELPAAWALLNPKQPGCSYPYKELSGCGIGFKLLQALFIQGYLEEQVLWQGLDLVALSIAADIVPMQGENRILTYYGLQRLNTEPRPGLQALEQVAGHAGRWHVSDLVFGLAPRINAPGRLSHARKAVELLSAPTLAAALPLAQELDEENTQRKALDRALTQEALDCIAADPQGADRATTVLFDPSWHKGLLGIAAARCMEHHYRPTILLTEHEGQATGSARSVAGYNLYEALQRCAGLLSRFGGHAYAAGMSLPLEHVPRLQERFEAIVAGSLAAEQRLPVQAIDLEVPLGWITPALYQVLQRLAPFGPQHRRPVLLSSPVYTSQVVRYQDKHLKMRVYQPGDRKSHTAMAFQMAAAWPYVQKGRPFAMAYTLEEHSYQERRTLQLTVKDLRPLAS